VTVHPIHLRSDAGILIQSHREDIMQLMDSQSKTGFFYFEGLGQWAVPQINSAGNIWRMIASSFC